MDKRQFKLACIHDIQRLAQALTPDTITETEDLFSRYFDAIRAIDQLPDTLPLASAPPRSQREESKSEKRGKSEVVRQASSESIAPPIPEVPSVLSNETSPVTLTDTLQTGPVDAQGVMEEADENVANDPGDEGEDKDFAGIDFDGKTVLVVGLAPRKAAYRAKIEALGGAFLHAEGGEKEQRLNGLIQKADVVVMIRSHISHGASFAVARLCKDNKAKLVTTASRGIKSVVRSAAIRLGIIEESADNIISECAVSRISNRMSG